MTNTQKMTEYPASDPQQREKKSLFSLLRLVGQQEQGRNLKRAGETMNREDAQPLA